MKIREIERKMGSSFVFADADDKKQSAAAKLIWKKFENNEISRNQLFDQLKPFGWTPSEIRAQLDG